jgi:hypothetical protein
MLIEISGFYVTISVLLFSSGCFYGNDGTDHDMYYYLGLVYGSLFWPIVMLYSILIKI